jgi:hypothetical protein
LPDAAAHRAVLMLAQPARRARRLRRRRLERKRAAPEFADDLAVGTVEHQGRAFGLDIEQPSSESIVDGSTISENTIGLFTRGGAVLRLSNSNVSLNGTGVNRTVESFSNNRFSSNGPGGAITPIGQPTSATGQQSVGRTFSARPPRSLPTTSDRVPPVP